MRPERRTFVGGRKTAQGFAVFLCRCWCLNGTPRYTLGYADIVKGVKNALYYPLQYRHSVSPLSKGKNAVKVVFCRDFIKG